MARAINGPLTPAKSGLSRSLGETYGRRSSTSERRIVQIPKLTIPFFAASLGGPRELSSARTARSGGHQDDKAKPWLHRGRSKTDARR